MDTTTLKVGDSVGIGGGGFHNGVCEIRKVVRRTATQVTLDNGTRWNSNGRRIGERGYYHGFLMTEQEAVEINEETKKRMERQALVRSVRGLEFGNISDDGLRMMLTVAKDHAL